MNKPKVVVCRGVQKIFDVAYTELGEKAWGKCRLYMSDEVFKALVRQRGQADRRKAKVEAQLRATDDMTMSEAENWLVESGFAQKRAAMLLWKRRYE